MSARQSCLLQAWGFPYRNTLNLTENGRQTRRSAGPAECRSGAAGGHASRAAESSTVSLARGTKGWTIAPKILAEARALNIAGAHFVGAVVMAYIDGDLTLPGQRTPVDDYIDELNALRSQVAHIGRNVKQIAKRLNYGGHPQPGDTGLLAQTDRSLDAVSKTIKSIAAAANQAVSSKAA